MKDERVTPCSGHEVFILHPSYFILAFRRHSTNRSYARESLRLTREPPARRSPPPARPPEEYPLRLPRLALDVTFPLQTLEFDRVLTLIALEAKSTLGKDAIGRRRPLAKRAACDAAQADLADMLRYYHREGLLPLAGLADVAPLLARKSVLELGESLLGLRARPSTPGMR